MLGLSALLFAVFAINVVSGAFFGGVFLSDVPEMLTLLAAAVAFVAAILMRESASRTRKNKTDPREN